MNLTKVASINIGEEVTALSINRECEVYYGSVSGQIGVIKVIKENDYYKLKPIEEQLVK